MGESQYMPRHEECIDTTNGQDAGFEGFGVGYESSISITSDGNMVWNRLPTERGTASFRR